jgi:predicted O-linked N-acetylglucosamine transferase (SPINDLY family)
MEAKKVSEAATRHLALTPADTQPIASGTDPVTAALALQQAGRLLDARAAFLDIVSGDPKNVAALHSMAVLEANAQNTEAALAYVERALSCKGDFAPSLQVRAVLRARLRLDGSVSTLRGPAQQVPQASPATSLAGGVHDTDPQPTPQPNSAVAMQINALALQAQQQGDLPKAQALLEKALELDPHNFVALYSLAVIHNLHQRHEQALELLRTGVRHHPGESKLHFAMGTVLQSLGLYESALASLDRAIEADPDSTEAYNNKTSLQHSMGRPKDALLTAEAALARKPEDQKSLNNRGYLLSEYKMYPEAAATFGKLLQLNPDYELARGLHLFARMHACDWTGFEREKQLIIEGVRAGKRTCSPMPFMAIAESASDARKCGEIFGMHKFPPAPVPLWEGQKYLHRRKRVAFISGDFRQHPVGYLLVGLIEHLRGGQLETYGVSVGTPDDSDLYRRFRCGFDHYLEVKDKTGLEIARLLRAHEIDIAIDLSGYTAGSRLEILSHRPAPVQMTYLGYPGTLGLPYIDYLIADRYTVPEHLASGYSEKILYLPHCYLPRDVSVLPSAAPQSRSAHGLPEKATVFCSFNHDYKISPTIFDCWLEMLREVPGSVLWLMKLNDAARSNLMTYASDRGVSPDRLIFAQRVPDISDHLARYRLADVFLDTYPYNGHTTASDALLAGLPVVTLSGETFASRVAGSLLHDLGLGDEWVGTNPREYRRKALEVVARTDSALSSRRHLEKSCAKGWPVSVEAQLRGFVTALNQAL